MSRKMPSTSLFCRNIDRDPPTLGENVAVEQNLFQRLVDEGDTILSHALQTKMGREIYGRLKEDILDGEPLLWTYNIFYDEILDVYHERQHSLTLDDVKILVLKMIEKAVGDLIKKELPK